MIDVVGYVLPVNTCTVLMLHCHGDGIVVTLIRLQLAFDYWVRNHIILMAYLMT